MKVLILSHLYPNKTNPSYGIFVHQQVKKLVELGIEVKVIAPVPYSPGILHFYDKWRDYGSIPDRENIEGIEVYHPRYIALPRQIFFDLSGYNYYYGIKSLVANIYRDFNFDLINAHVALPDGFAGKLLKKKYESIPLLVTIHGDDVNNVIHKNKKCRKSIVSVFKEADCIIANSQRTKSKIARFYDKKDKIHLIYNGVSQKLISKADQHKQMDFVSDKTKIILTVARLQKVKGIDYAIKALAGIREIYSDFKYIVIGDGAEREYLIQLAKDYDLIDKIEFLGRKSNSTVMEYMSKCDIFILPSWNEAFGMVYLEALANAKAVIGCRGQGVEEIIEDGISGLLVNAKDVIDLQEKILNLLTDSHLSQMIGNAGQKTVIENFTLEASVNKLIHLYKSILEDKR
ncbi:MAG: glycosyltransferase [Halanaerobiales bacterium]